MRNGDLKAAKRKPGGVRSCEAAELNDGPGFFDASGYWSRSTEAASLPGALERSCPG